MRLSKVMIAVALSLFWLPTTSFADSEFFWQAAAGQSAFTAGLEYDGTKEELIAGGEQRSQGPTIHFAFDYGFNEMFDFGISTEYASLSQSKPGFNTTQIGLGDFVFFAKGSVPFDILFFKFGVILSVSPENAHLKSGNDKNNYSGRFTATPYIGLETDVDIVSFGFRLSDDVAQTDIKEDVDSTGKTDAINGGNQIIFDLFSEVNYGQGQLGFKIEKILTSTLNDNTNNTNTVVPTSTGLVVYGTRNLGAVTLIGQVKYAKLGGTDTLSYGTDWDYQFAVRLAF